MCGIVGYVGPKNATPILIDGLARLEYRGYDSAGIAVISDQGALEVRKAAGNLQNLRTAVADAEPAGYAGIGHTRWATHGRPSDTNAHPHSDCRAQIAVVHNGIVENYGELRKLLAGQGHRFRSQTDTEVIAHLIEHHHTHGLAAAVLRAARQLKGAFAIACVAAEEPNSVVALRHGTSPLVIGFGTGEMFITSDLPAFLGETGEILQLEERELALLTPEGPTLRTRDG